MEEVRPAYGGRSFADIPATVVRLLTGDGGPGIEQSALGELDRLWRKIVLVVVDGFGWSAAERHADHPFLKRVAADGVLAKLTSQFPSTTSAHMTSAALAVPITGRRTSTGWRRGG